MDDILKKLFGDQEGVLNESAQKTLTEAINAKVDELVEEKLNLALEAQDKEHVGMLQTIVERYEQKGKDDLKTLEESIDEDHAKVVEETFEKVEADRAEKLVAVKEHYEDIINNQIVNEATAIAKSVDSYLDKWLDEHLPTKFIEEAAKKDYSQELLGKISKLVTVDQTVSEDIRAGMIDARDTIAEQAKVIDQLKKDKFLAESTANLPKLEQKFITENFANKDFEYTQRNLAYLRKLYAKNQSAPLVEKTTGTNVDRKPQILQEQAPKVSDERESTPSAMSEWVRRAKITNL